LQPGAPGGADHHGGHHRGARRADRDHRVHRRLGRLQPRVALCGARQLAADQRRDSARSPGDHARGDGASVREAGDARRPPDERGRARELTRRAPQPRAAEDNSSRGFYPMQTSTETLEQYATQDYRFGFVTDVEQDLIPPGLSEEVVRLISAKKGEPEWLLEWRLKAYRAWLKMTEPTWANIHYPPIDYQSIVYYASPKAKTGSKSLDEVDPEILATYAKLGIPLKEQELLAGVAVDAVFDSVSVATTFKGKLAEMGIIFSSFSEAVKDHPELVQKYLGSVVPYTDNFFATLNSAVFSDGSFVYVPKG